MKEREQAERILREMATAMGLSIVGEAYGCRVVMMPCTTEDAYVARLYPTFTGTAVGRNARPLASVKLAHQDLVDATPEALLGMVTNACAAAKSQIVAQLKEALARLEASP